MEKNLIEYKPADLEAQNSTSLEDAMKFFQYLPMANLIDLPLSEYDKNFQTLVSNFPKIPEIKIDLEQELKVIKKIEEKVGVKWTDKNSEDLVAIQSLLQREEEELEKLKADKNKKNFEGKRVLEESQKEIQSFEKEVSRLNGEIGEMEEHRKSRLKCINGYSNLLGGLGVKVIKNGEGFVIQGKDDAFEIELTGDSRYKMKNKGKTFMYGNSEFVYPTELSSHFAKLVSRDDNK